MRTNILAALLAFGFSATGLFAFFLPEHFFNLLPSYYGSLNIHFVKDAGLSFLSSGLLLTLSLTYAKWRIPLTLGGILFVFLHGLFHAQMLINGMASTFTDLAVEIIVIIIPSVLAFTLLLLRIKENYQQKQALQ